MPLVGTEQMADRRLCSRRGLVIALAIVGLTLSLASRVAHVSFDLNPTVHSDSSYNKVQHRDKDSFQWVSPVASVCLLWVSEYKPSSAPNERIPFRLQYDNLYNRPPPTA